MSAEILGTTEVLGDDVMEMYFWGERERSAYDEWVALVEFYILYCF